MKALPRALFLIGLSFTLACTLFGSHLDLSSNGITDQELVELHALWGSSLDPQYKDGITRLNLQKNELGDLSTVELMRAALVFKNLRQLDLSNNYFTYKSLSTILKYYYKFSGIEFFDISNNLISEEEAQQLAAELQAMKGVSLESTAEFASSLVLSRPCDPDRFNNYTESGYSIIITDNVLTLTRENNRSPEFFSITNDIEESFFLLLKEIFNKPYCNIKLCTLRVKDPVRARQVWSALHHTITPKQCMYIHTLDISSTPITKIFVEMDSFAEFLQLASVRTLIARNCEIKSQFFNKLIISLNKESYFRNTTLTTLDISKNPIRRDHVNQIQKSIPNFFSYRSFLKWEVNADADFTFVVHPHALESFKSSISSEKTASIIAGS